MNLTPEQLDMIKRLQPVFTAKIKEWADDDLCYCNQCGNQILTYWKHGQQCPVEPLWIPRPIDWQNPERGLWGMVDWERWILSTDIDNTKVYIRSTDCDIKDDPFTALLKALCHQEVV